MKLSFTINLGNYESMRVESSELPTAEMCMEEILNLLTSRRFKFRLIPAVQSFINKYLDKLETKRDYQILKNIVERLEKEPQYSKGVPESAILIEAESEAIDRSEAMHLLFKLREAGKLYSPRPKHYKVVHEGAKNHDPA